MAKVERDLTIGFQSLSLYGSYYNSLLQGLCEEARQQKINLILFPGRCSPYLARYEYQNTLIYNFMTKENLDGLIVTPGSMIDLIGFQKTMDFYGGIKDLPLLCLNIGLPESTMIGINNQSGFRELMAHLFDVHAFRKPAFINGPMENSEAQQRFNVFRKSLEERSIPYLEDLRVFGNFTFESGVSAVKELLDNRRGSDCDVVIASNDSMALGAIEELSRRGIKVPEDMAVTGFDNLNEGFTSIPSLTTVAQPLREQAHQAVKTLVSLIKGEAMNQSMMFETHMVIRKSCGCMGFENNGEPEKKSNESVFLVNKHQTRKLNCKAFQARATAIGNNRESELLTRSCCALFDTHIKSGLKNTLAFLKDFNRLCMDFFAIDRGMEIIELFLSSIETALKDLFISDSDSSQIHYALQGAHKLLIEYRDAKQANQMLQNEQILYRLRFLIRDSSAFLSFDQFLDTFFSAVASIGIDRFLIILFNEPIFHKDETKMKHPVKMEILSSHFSDTKPSANIVFDYPMMVPPEFMKNDSGIIYIATALFFREEQYGYILMEYKKISYEIYEILATQISTTYKRLLMMQEISNSEQKLRRALDELQSYTHHLQHISEMDELTALYNRRGFLTLAASALELAEKESKSCILFFFDLDGLKEINDNYGHEEGDYALKTAASILRSSFRSSDIIGRLGGDEFVVFSPTVDSRYINAVIERFQKKTVLVNKEINKAFKIFMSYGWSVSNNHDKSDINLMLQTADAMLYNNKKNRKKH
ncbi:MAG: GGDEF domain-containing protein [Spirochaetales bacterium]|nr:GGDEF domain-containing protein [Spirochaetales bacterium]